MSTGRKIAIGLSLAVCLLPAGLSAMAWWTHGEWLRTGAYHRNSFPVGGAAEDLSWLTLCVWLGVAGAWGVYGVVRRFRG
jgi:hypothetical protein